MCKSTNVVRLTYSEYVKDFSLSSTPVAYYITFKFIATGLLVHLNWLVLILMTERRTKYLLK